MCTDSVSIYLDKHRHHYRLYHPLVPSICLTSRLSFPHCGDLLVVVLLLLLWCSPARLASDKVSASPTRDSDRSTSLACAG